MLLDATTKSLEMVLSGAVTTAQLEAVVFYADHALTTFSPGEQSTTSNNTTAVAIAAAPESGYQRQIKSLSIYNKDSAQVTVTVQLNSNSTIYKIITIKLDTKETLQYHDHDGFKVLSSTGAIKSTTTTITYVAERWWMYPFRSFYDPTTAFPVAPDVGDRYISSATATHGGVTWTENYIYEWDGAAWVETAPVDGMIIHWLRT